MQERKTIAIIESTDSAGSSVTSRNLAASGKYRLLLVPGRNEDLRDDKLYADPTSNLLSVNCEREASWEADIILIETPHADICELALKMTEVTTGKIIIRMEPGGMGSDYRSASDETATRTLQEMLPHSIVFAVLDSRSGVWIVPQETSDILRSVYRAALEAVVGIVGRAGLELIGVRTQNYAFVPS